jgi:hypothetical protein
LTAVTCIRFEPKKRSGLSVLNATLRNLWAGRPLARAGVKRQQRSVRSSSNGCKKLEDTGFIDALYRGL